MLEGQETSFVQEIAHLERVCGDYGRGMFQEFMLDHLPIEGSPFVNLKDCLANFKEIEKKPIYGALTLLWGKEAICV